MIFFPACMRNSSVWTPRWTQVGVTGGGGRIKIQEDGVVRAVDLRTQEFTYMVRASKVRDCRVQWSRPHVDKFLGARIARTHKKPQAKTGK